MNHDFPTEDDDLGKCVLKLSRTTPIKPRQIERSGFFYQNTTDKLELKDWSEVQHRVGSGEIAIFLQRIPPGIIRVNINNAW